MLKDRNIKSQSRNLNLGLSDSRIQAFNYDVCLMTCGGRKDVKQHVEYRHICIKIHLYVHVSRKERLKGQKNVMLPKDELCLLSIVGERQGGNDLPPRRLEGMPLALRIATPHTQMLSFLYSTSSFIAISQVRNLSLREAATHSTAGTGT